MKGRLVISCIILSTLLANTSVYADVIGQNKIVSTAEVNNVLVLKDNNVVTYKKMMEEVTRYFNKEVDMTSYKDTEVTIRDFLLIFDAFSDIHFFYVYKNDLIYFLEDSYWLSENEWKEVFKNLDKPLTEDFMSLIFKRTTEMQKISEELENIRTYAQYQKFIDTFVPRYSNLIRNNKEAVEDWLAPKDGSIRLITDSKIGNILHEVLHEDSIKRETSDYRRTESFSKKSIELSGKPDNIYYFNHKTGEYVCIDFIKNVPTSKIILKNVPKDVQETANYKNYFVNNENCTAYAWGIYGMMQEYISYIVNINTNIVESAVGYKDINFNHANYLRTYLWKGCILEYLCVLEEKYPKVYNEIINDVDFISLIVDTIDYAEDRYILFLEKNTRIPGNLAAIDWCISDKLMAQMDKLREIAENEEYDIVIAPTEHGSISVEVAEKEFYAD